MLLRLQGDSSTAKTSSRDDSCVAHIDPPIEEGSLPLPAVSAARSSSTTMAARFRITNICKNTWWRLFHTSPPSTTLDDSEQNMRDIYCPTPVQIISEDEDEDEVLDVLVVDGHGSSDVMTSPAASPDDHNPYTLPLTTIHSGGSSDLDTHARFWTFSYMRHCLPRLVCDIFFMRFSDDKMEHEYVHTRWFTNKYLSVWSAAWYIIIWIFGVALPYRPFQLMDEIFYYGIAPAFSAAVFLSVVLDWPHHHAMLYQWILTFAAWMWPLFTVLYMFLCGLYDPSFSKFSCGNRDFISAMYYATAMQTVALFGLDMHRFAAAVGACVYFVITCAVIVVHRHVWSRTVINYVVFYAFIIFVHYRKEKSDRYTFRLRKDLALQAKVALRAQKREYHASDSKRRLTSYVFHDDACECFWCRGALPLSHFVVLALQNLEDTCSFADDIYVDALKGSLEAMSQVLNDVLDLLDSGKFEFSHRPFSFHGLIRSLMIPLQLTASARGLNLAMDLDPEIDKVARQAAYVALGKTENEIQKLQEYDDHVDGIFLGDATRLRQANGVNSNACKFTPTGGKLTVTTRLVSPVPDGDENGHEVPLNGHVNEERLRLSAKRLSQPNSARADIHSATIRVEVTDTGCGIHKQDMVGKLFSPFTQTQKGVQQGGKGSGLGLALVRSIIKQAGGRMGVKSKIGGGSTFWFEYRFGVGRQIPLDKLDEMVLSTVSAVRASADAYVQGAGDTRPPISRTNSSAEDTRVNRLARTDSVLHRLMDQGSSMYNCVVYTQCLVLPGSGGPVELTLDRRGSVSPANGRMLGTVTRSSTRLSDTSTGTGSPRATSMTDIDADAGYKDVASAATQSITLSRSDYISLSSYASSRDLRPVKSVQDRFVPDDRRRPTHIMPTRTHSSQMPTSPRILPLEFQVPQIQLEANLPVLVVEDDSVTRMMMGRRLQMMGCNPSLAVDGVQGLQMLLGEDVTVDSSWTLSSDGRGEGLEPILERTVRRRSSARREPEDEESLHSSASSMLENQEGSEGPYAVVFLDNQMPGLPGTKVVEMLRRLGRTDFVVGLTGNAMVSDQEEFLRAGVDILHDNKMILRKRTSFLALLVVALLLISATAAPAQQNRPIDIRRRGTNGELGIRSEQLAAHLDARADGDLDIRSPEPFFGFLIKAAEKGIKGVVDLVKKKKEHKKEEQQKKAAEHANSAANNNNNNNNQNGH
ncbi:hypothetical protein FISHEDRAFT_70425 [Fistulina hepatica ATCC 64428]|uniref:histidine kinase n=1 Tax=Fistulina hepatica ATCC 64428 TaxID=1128425 RepID=A0A0D7AJJ4_9AGAR|nr:hypothetical protein FISHEDRAFT_70425 [Fistulina hepatica ATCC 64428]